MKLYALTDYRLTVDTGECDSLIDPYLDKLYSGEWNKDRILEEVYFHNIKSMLAGFEQGYGKKFFSPEWTMEDNNLLSRVQNNIFAFSGAKCFAELEELRDAVYENGKLASPGDFRRKARQINARYNLNYLDAERQQVIAAGTQGSRWIGFEETKDTHPYLEYVTARDEHVREEHRNLDGLIYPVDDPFWDRYYPPNGWRCRCTVRKCTEREYTRKTGNYESRTKTPMPSSGDAQRIGGKVVAKPFRHNVGKSRIVFEDGHPYFQANADAKVLQLSAVKNYGMKPVKEIYGHPKKLSGYKQEIHTEDDYREYWRILEAQYGKEGEGFTLVDRKNNISARFDSALKEKLLKRGRFDYFDEAIDVFNTPDEVWATQQTSSTFDNELYNVYLRYYKDTPIVLLVNMDGRVDSFYKWEKNINDFEKFRVGLLKQKR